MPWKARIVVPNCPHHVVQRGHNRQVIFAEAGDYRYYLEHLTGWKEWLGCRIYGDCLMTNHVHLIVDPGDDRWTSYRAKADGEPVQWLDLDPCYQSLGATEEMRQQRYQAWVRAGTNESELKYLREALQRGQLTGNHRFIQQVEERIRIRVEQRGRVGRVNA